MALAQMMLTLQEIQEVPEPDGLATQEAPEVKDKGKRSKKPQMIDLRLFFAHGVAIRL